MEADDFDFDLITEFGGYVSSKDKTNVSPNVLVKGSQNVYKKLSGTVAARPGLKLRGSTDNTQAGVDSSFEWYTSLASVYPMRVANGKLQFESDIVSSGTYVWYDLLTGLTLNRFVFDTWWNNALKKDVLLFVKGDSDIQMWHGGVALISSTTVNTIVLDRAAATAGFPTSGGTVIINGTTYTFTGVSASTLTGVTADPTGEANGSVVMSGIVTTSNSPASGFTNDFIKTIGNRLHVGSYTSRLVYISSQSDYTNFTVPGTRAPGDPELLTLDDAGQGITVRQGNAHIFGGTSSLYIVSYTPITVGSTLTEQTKVDKKQLGNLVSALAHEFIDILGDNIIYLDQNNQLRTYGTFRNLLSDKSPSLSQQVHDELMDEDFTGGHLRIVSGDNDDIVYITAPVTGKTFFYQERSSLDPAGNVVAERIWHPPQIWNASRIAVIDGIEYCHSNANPQLYQLWKTGQWYDDSPSGDELPYEAIMRMSYRGIITESGQRRQGMLAFDKMYSEGYIAQGTNLDAYVLYDYQGSSGMVNPNINSIESPVYLFTGVNPASLGDSSIGSNPLGDTLIDDPDNQEVLPKFRNIVSVGSNNCFEYQLVIYSTDVNSRWEILALGTNAKITEKQNATFLIKNN